jgi:hypothetical protein
MEEYFTSPACGSFISGTTEHPVKSPAFHNIVGYYFLTLKKF